MFYYAIRYRDSSLLRKFSLIVLPSWDYLRVYVIESLFSCMAISVYKRVH